MMGIFTFFFVLFSLLLTARIFYSLFYLPRVRSLLRATEETHEEKTESNDTIFYIIIPLLNEVNIFPTLARRLESAFGELPNTKIVFITTEREKVNQKSLGENTITLVEKYVEECNSDRIKHIHYPNINTRVAEQLNYALEYLQKENEKQLERVYFGFYNADSNISKRTLPALISQINRYPEVHVFQQSSAFLANEFRGPFRFLLISNALRQTRWTFLYEIPRYIRDWPEILNLVHVVTHGLFVRGDVLRQVGNFPIDSFGEDLYLGFILHAFGFKIKPIPVLENSESPATVRAMLRQKFVWYWGPLGYFFYWLRLRKRFPKIWIKNKLSIITTSVLGMLDALNWLLAGIFFAAYVLIGFSLDIKLGVFSALFVSLYFLITCIYTLVIYSEREDCEIFPKVSVYNTIGAILCYPLVVLVHGVPPLVTIYKESELRITKESFLRPKTERS